MSFTWTDNCFESGHVAQTDLQNIENNCLALKKSFESTGAPSNAVAGMPWFDSSTGFLKYRNSANSAWKNLLDVDSGFAINCGRTVSAGAGLSGGGQLTANRTISHAAHTGHVTGTAALTIANGVVSTAKLNTTTQTITHDGDADEHTATLTGGSYCFLVQVKSSNATQTIKYHQGYVSASSPGTSYVTPITYQIVIGTAYTLSILSRYVTASGPVFWVFGLLNKITEKVHKKSFAIDHPCYGNGGDPATIQHPFCDYDEEKWQLIVSNPPPEQLGEYKKMAFKKDMSLNEYLSANCDFDFSRTAKWPTQPVTVGVFPDPHDVPMGYEVQRLKKLVPPIKGALVLPLSLRG
jgi:hypothetical protein